MNVCLPCLSKTHLYFPEEVGEALEPISVEPFDGYVLPHEPPSEHGTEAPPTNNGAVGKTRTGCVDLLMAAGGQNRAVWRIGNTQRRMRAKTMETKKYWGAVSSNDAAVRGGLITITIMTYEMKHNAILS